MIVQGDVFFTKINDIPKKAKSRKKTERGYVIAEGEATGHAHVIDEDIEFYESKGVLYLRTDRDVQVRHEEHKPVTLGKGIWKVGIVREYDPFVRQERIVKD